MQDGICYKGYNTILRGGIPMREKIIAYLKQKNKSEQDSKHALLSLIFFQTFYPIPFVFVLFFGDEFTKICVIYTVINSIIATITGIVFSRIKKLNNAIVFNFITMLEWGVNFLVFVIAIYRYVYKSIIPCFIIIFCAVCIVVFDVIYSRKYIEKEKYKKKKGAKEYICGGVGLAFPLIGRNIAAMIFPKMEQNKVMEIVAIILMLFSVFGLIFAVDGFMMLYYIGKYKIDIDSEIYMLSAQEVQKR